MKGISKLPQRDQQLSPVRGRGAKSGAVKSGMSLRNPNWRRTRRGKSKKGRGSQAHDMHAWVSLCSNERAKISLLFTLHHQCSKNADFSISYKTSPCHHHRKLQPSHNWLHPKGSIDLSRNYSQSQRLSYKSSTVNRRTNSLSDPSAPESPAADWLSTPASETALSWQNLIGAYVMLQGKRKVESQHKFSKILSRNISRERRFTSQVF